MNHTKDMYEQLMTEVQDTGTLSLTSRQTIRSYITFADNKQLAFSCIEKVLAIWNQSDYSTDEVKPVLRYLKDHIQDESFGEEAKDTVCGFLENIEAIIKETDNFMAGYLFQALHDILLFYMQETAAENAASDEEQEFDELETACCACMIWRYQDEKSDSNTRKQREAQFWIWYLTEAARMQGMTLSQEVTIEAASHDDIRSIVTMKDFVKAISYEFDYISHDYKDGEITIRVFNLKDGACCTECHQFSARVKDNYSGIMKLGKLKGIPVKLYITNNLYYCDNPDCPEEAFMTKSNVDYKERAANYKQIIKELGSQSVLEILGVK